MKAPNRVSASQKLSHEIQLARIQLAKATGQWKFAKEQARLAKSRRKEAKEAARRARKLAKLAKRAVADAKQILAEAEKKLARPVKRKAVAAPGKKATKTAAAPARKSVKPKKSERGPTVPGLGNQSTDEPAQTVVPNASTSHAPSSDQPPTLDQTAA